MKVTKQRRGNSEWMDSLDALIATVIPTLETQRVAGTVQTNVPAIFWVPFKFHAVGKA